EEQVVRTPLAPAVADAVQTYNYETLNERANRLAHYLKGLGVGPDKLVGVALERSSEMVAVLLAVHKAGGAYIPLDPAFPESRLAMMLDDAQPAVLLTESALLDDGSLSWLSAREGQMKVVSLDGDWVEIEQQPTENPGVTADPNALAYIIYTSGSTGKPKGVQIPHRALVNFLTTMARRPGLTAEDTLLAVTTLSFDIAGLELFLPLMVGAEIVIADRETAADADRLQRMMKRHNVTVMQATPATWQLLLAANWSGRSSLKILSGGEALPAELASKLLARSAELWNVYGPTETTIWSTVHQVTAADVTDTGRAVSIGRPIGNTQIYILDQQMQPVPVGVVGDLYIGGDGLARGYYKRPGLTAERFVPSPFVSGERLYRTGDLARCLPDGNIIFLGRSDFQVKIRGYRIELGDIEAALDQLPQVAQSVVAAKSDGHGEHRLVAYLVGRQDAEVPTVEQLRASLAETLPGYMIPAVFFTLDAFPLTPTGKVDRKSLPEPTIERGQMTAEYVAPRTPLEQELAELCANVLGLEKVGIHDSFFDLGGNSLMATRLISRVRELADGPVPLRLLFAEPTVAGLARAIEVSGTEQGDSGGGLFEEKTVEELLADAVLDPTITAGKRVYTHTAEPENILLTGATGFVGAFLLRDLLVETDAAIFCLVRAADQEGGLQRLERNLSRYGIWKPDFYDRIVPVLGDLGQPHLGLTAEQYNDLAETIEVIYHNGAMVNFVYPYEAHKAANVRGTEEILRLAAQGELKPVHFVSTLSVFHTGHHNDGTVFAEKDNLEQVGVPFGGYAQSKWVAEKLVMTAVSRGIPAAIYRPGLVSGDSETGAWNTDDMMTTLARASLAVGAVPELDVQVDIVPVNYVSGAIVALSRRPQTIGGTYHLANTGPMDYEALLAWIESQGLELEQVPFIEWRQRLSDLMTAVGGDEVAAFAPLLDEVTAEQIFMPTIDCANTLTGLEESAVACAPVDGRLLETYLYYLLGEEVETGD
ncbi:MAG: amino acid adenylation domain-containing protein, partial [Candidatus Promineifilaceae bacterium]